MFRNIVDKQKFKRAAAALLFSNVYKLICLATLLINIIANKCFAIFFKNNVAKKYCN